VPGETPNAYPTQSPVPGAERVSDTEPRAGRDAERVPDTEPRAGRERPTRAPCRARRRTRTRPPNAYPTEPRAGRDAERISDTEPRAG
jgi:hypothetical protein